MSYFMATPQKYWVLLRCYETRFKPNQKQYLQLVPTFYLVNTFGRTLVGKSTTFNVVYLAQNEANHKDLLFNEMVQQTSWQAICMCIFVLLSILFLRRQQKSRHLLGAISVTYPLLRFIEPPILVEPIRNLDPLTNFSLPPWSVGGSADILPGDVWAGIRLFRFIIHVGFGATGFMAVCPSWR